MPTIEANTAQPVQITPQNQTPAIPNGILYGRSAFGCE